jgi:hypothetical protein
MIKRYNPFKDSLKFLKMIMDMEKYFGYEIKSFKSLFLHEKELRIYSYIMKERSKCMDGD